MAPSFWQKHGQKLTALFIWLAVIGGYLFYSRKNGLSPAEMVDQLEEIFRSGWGVPLYILVYWLRPILFFPATVLSVAGAAIFGPIGVLWTIIGANGSAMVAYLIGRYFGQGMIDLSKNEGILGRYAQQLHQNSFTTVLLLRLIYAPYDLVNYLSGLLQIDWKAFLLGTALGSLPGTLVFSLLGVSLNSGKGGIDWRIILFSLSLFIASLLLSRYLKKRNA